jgi:hypothetical protein
MHSLPYKLTSPCCSLEIKMSKTSVEGLKVINPPLHDARKRKPDLAVGCPAQCPVPPHGPLSPFAFEIQDGEQ